MPCDSNNYPTQAAVSFIASVTSHYNALMCKALDTDVSATSVYKTVKAELATLKGANSDLTDREVAEISAKTIADMATKLSDSMVKVAYEVALKETELPYEFSKSREEANKVKQEANQICELLPLAKDKQTSEIQLNNAKIASEAHRSNTYKKQADTYKEQAENFRIDKYLSFAEIYGKIAASKVVNGDSITAFDNANAVTLEGRIKTELGM